MSSIDDRVVNMQFNNAQFQEGVAQTNKSLSDLKNNLRLDGATSGIDNIQAASDHFSLQGMEDAISNISSHFSIFGAVGFTVIQDLTNTALNAGRQIAGGIIDPLVQGGSQRALALQQAKFQFQGLGLDIQSTMDAALGAVKGTSFGLDDAATAAAQFGASGITATNGLENVLRSVAGVAAQTGSSYSSVAQIFESVAGNGRLMGQDLLQLSSRGVNAAAVLAKSMGTTEENVRAMVTKGKISFKEFSDAMSAAFGANAANANQTYNGALDNMHAALARIGADVASPYFLGMRDVFNALGPLFDTIHTAMAPFLTALAWLQGYEASGVVSAINWLDKGIQTFMGANIGQSLLNMIKSVEILGGAFKAAFTEIFPPATDTQLAAIGAFFERFTALLVPGTKAADDIRRALAGFFAVVDIGVQLVMALGKVLFDLFDYSVKGSGGFLDFTAKIGDWLVKLDNAIKQGDVFTKFFQVLGGIIAGPIAILKTFFGIIADGVKDLGHFNTKGLDDFADDVATRFKGLNDLGKFFAGFWNGVIDVAKAVYGFLQPIFLGIAEAIHNAVGRIKDSLGGLNFGDSLQALNTGIFAGFLVIVNGFFGNLGGILRGNGLAIVTSFKKVFSQLQLNLKALEMNTNAKTLESIAISVALLAASAVALSLVDSGKLATALVAMGGMIKGLLVAFEAFSKIGGAKGLLETIAISVAIEGIAAAVLVLTGAIAILGAIPMANIVKGVLALVVVLGALTLTLRLLKDIGPGVLYAAGALALIAPAMAALAGAIAILGALPMGNLIQGMIAFTLILGELVGAVKLLSSGGPGLLFAAIALAAMGGAIATVVGVVAILGALKLPNLIQGLVALAVTLGIMAAAMAVMDGTVVGSAAMVIAAFAITILAGAMKIFSTMSWDDIGRSMVLLGGSLLILAAAMALMGLPPVLLGSVGILAASVAMLALAPSLVLLGTVSWDSIGRGLTLLGAGLAIMAVGGILLIPASVGFLLLGAAILILGTGILEAATGMAIFAVALTALVALGTAGTKMIVAGIQAVIDKMPALGTGIGQAIVAMAVVIGQDAPKLVTAFTNVINAMLDGVNTTIPHIMIVATNIIVAFCGQMIILLPTLVTTGMKILTGILNGIAKNLPGLITAATNVIVAFLEGIGNNIHRVTDAGADLVVKFVQGTADSINSHRKAMQTAGGNLAMAIADGMTGGLASKVKDVVNAAQNLVRNIPAVIKTLLHIASPSKVTTELGEFTGEGIAVGLDNKTDRVISSATGLGQAAINGLKDSVAGIKDAMSDNIDNTPVIRPVLDISSIKDGANKINSLLTTPPMSISNTTSTDVATSVALQEQAKNAQLVLDAKNSDPSNPNGVTFIQNNNSPVALSTPEIYRQTQNQLSTLKGDLGVVNQNPTY